MADPKANPLMFSGNAADMLKQYGQAVPEQQPLSSLEDAQAAKAKICLLYTSPSPRDATLSRMPSSA